MRYDRRTFVKTGALALAGTAFLGNTYCSGADRKTITGLQLYSLRDDMGTNPLGTLTRLAQMGYVYLEHASYSERRFYGFPANEFRKIIDDRGLKMISGHITLGRQDWDAALNDFNTVIMMNDGNSAYYLNRARVYRQLGRLPEAIQDVRVAEEKGAVIGPELGKLLRNKKDKK